MSAGNPDSGATDSDAGTESDAESHIDAAKDGNALDSQVDSDTGSVTDRPYANVVAVAVSGNPRNYTFNVSVESADVDCSQFANWWEVLTEAGSLVFRRILQHCHTDENGTTDPNAPGNTFTRDGGPVDIEADDVVIVRAHMNTGGYNGTVMKGSVTGGFSEWLDIGADFALDVEAEDPQPTGCLF